MKLFRSHRISILVALSTFLTLQSQAQKSSFDFAETYFGIEASLDFQNEGYIIDGVNKDIPSTFSPRILIGGTHFWKRADFYISIPTTSLKWGGSKEVHSTNNIITGFRYLPFSLIRSSIRPYLGLAIAPKTLEISRSANYNNWQMLYEAGINFRTPKNRIWGLNFRYFPQTKFNAFVEENRSETITLNPFSFGVSFKQCLDFSASYKSEKLQNYLQKVRSKLKDRRALNTYGLAVGLSAYIPLEQTPYAEQYQYFNTTLDGKLNLDLGFSYFFHKPNLSLRLAYRNLKQEEAAFDHRISISRNSWSFEALKFIGNYHGFVPFVGPYVSADFHSFEEKINSAVSLKSSQTKMGYGLVFGWDIRFSDVEPFILRTNLRYNPAYSLQKDGRVLSASSLEFNFIQIVLYPERIKAFKN